MIWMQLTVQAFPKTRSAYCGSLKSGGHSGKPGGKTLSNACIQIDLDERLIRMERISFVVLDKFNKSVGSNWLNIWWYRRRQR